MTAPWSEKLAAMGMTVRELLREKGMNDVTVLIGGIIPEADIPALKKNGIAEVFLPGTPTQAIVDFIRQRTSAAPQGA